MVIVTQWGIAYICFFQVVGLAWKVLFLSLLAVPSPLPCPYSSTADALPLGLHRPLPLALQALCGHPHLQTFSSSKAGLAHTLLAVLVLGVPVLWGSGT